MELKKFSLSCVLPIGLCKGDSLCASWLLAVSSVDTEMGDPTGKYLLLPCEWVMWDHSATLVWTWQAPCKSKTRPHLTKRRPGYVCSLVAPPKLCILTWSRIWVLPCSSVASSASQTWNTQSHAIKQWENLQGCLPSHQEGAWGHRGHSKFYVTSSGVEISLEKAPGRGGGIFECMIKSTKRCLKKTIRQASLTYDELLTIVIGGWGSTEF